MSETATIEIVALGEKMLLGQAAKATGLPLKTMVQYVENGTWIEGKEWEVGEDRQARLIMSGFYAWVKSGTNKAKPLEPVPEVETQLYRHFDSDGVLLYVGISLFSVYRLAQHMNASRWSGRITTITVERFPSREAAFKAETAAIVAERPLFNIAKAQRAEGAAP